VLPHISEEAKVKTWAIVVGINKYDRQRTTLNELKGAVSDACDFAEWALDGAGGAVDSKNLYFWTYPWPEEPKGELKKYLEGQPPNWYDSDPLTANDTVPANQQRGPWVREIVNTALKIIGDPIRTARFESEEKTRILIFFAGHGLRAKEINGDREQTCFVAGDFRPQRGYAEGLVPCESFRRALRNEVFDEVLLFLDCCRRDSISLAPAAMPITNLNTADAVDNWGECYAAQDDNLAYETEEEPVRGVFSKTLLDGLRRHREGQPPKLTVAQLQEYVVQNIGTYTTKGQAPFFQFKPGPPLSMDIVSGAPTEAAPVSVVAATGPLLILDALPDGKSLVLRNSGGDAVWDGGPYPAGSAPVELPELAADLYALQLTDASRPEILFRQPGRNEISV
jgi:Caspase domain